MHLSCDKYVAGTTYRNTMVTVYVCVRVHTMTNAFVCYSGITSSVHINRVPTHIQMHLSCDQYVAGTTYRKTMVTVYACVLVHTMPNAFVCESGITSSAHIKRLPTHIQMHLSCAKYVPGTTHTNTIVTVYVCLLVHTMTNAFVC
jgi:hypothetical protein